jgi:hypothetical protein
MAGTGAILKTSAERKSAERARMRLKGYILRQFWVHPKDWPLVQKYLARVNRRRNNQPERLK